MKDYTIPPEVQEGFYTISPEMLELLGDACKSIKSIFDAASKAFGVLEKANESEHESEFRLSEHEMRRASKGRGRRYTAGPKKRGE